LPWIEIAGMGAMMFAAVIVILLLASHIFRAGVVNQLSVSTLFGRKAKG
jgi:hypothetical protein